MTIAACAELLQKGDPDRFLATMAAPVWAREMLFPLFAFNLEIARAPWASTQPLVSEMRLQWWRDVVQSSASGAARAHEVAGPLHQMTQTAGLPLDILDRMVAARRHDCWPDPFADLAALDGYIDDTAGSLMWLAARALGAPDAAEPATRAYGRAAGMAAYLRAAATLQARARQPFPEGHAVPDLAARGLGWLEQARAARKSVPKAVAPALLSGWQCAPLLRLAVAQPDRVASGTLHLSEFSRRGRLLWQTATGRW